VLYRVGTEWKPVDTPGRFGVAKDAANVVTFKPVKTDALRLEVVLQPEWSAGIHEWTVR
jgi:hypothetical protein